MTPPAIVQTEITKGETWMHAHTTATRWIIAVLALLLIVAGLYIGTHRDPPLISPEMRAREDSLLKTRAKDSLTMDSLRTVAEHAFENGAALVTKSQVQMVNANQQSVRANNAVHAATVRPIAPTDTTALLLKAAVDQLIVQVADLKAVVATQDSAIKSLTIAAATAQQQADAEHTRRIAVETVNDSLITAVNKAEEGCRFLWVIACPSRARAGVVGVAVGAVAVEALHIISARHTP